MAFAVSFPVARGPSSGLSGGDTPGVPAPYPPPAGYHWEYVTSAANGGERVTSAANSGQYVVSLRAN